MVMEFNEKHIDEVTQIIHDCYLEQPYSYDWKINNIKSYINRRSKTGWKINLLVKDDVVNGVIIYRDNDIFDISELKKDKDFLSEKLNNVGYSYVQDLCISKKFQRSGAGKALLDSIKGNILLFTLKKSPAVDFYRHLKYKEFDSPNVKNRVYFLKNT